MNVDSTSDSKSTRTITSKYFSGKPGMDESLSDFQEEKKNIAGQKKLEKPAIKTNKKAPKRIKGQKDIRTVLGSKKNELVAYSNDFEKICKQAGIDVDCEQLQLAIALSKSLQQDQGAVELQSSGLSPQERTGKIRTTLLEYGFKVPELKIIATKSRKLRRYKKYKLTSISEEEKQQTISDRYAQVLLQNVEAIEVNDENVYADIEIYFKATKISYGQSKDDIFYVNGLMERSLNTVGSLLKDWSEIPGRPSSPTLKPSNVRFHILDCSQEELDTLLSGVLKSAQNIAKEKHLVTVKDKTMNTLENTSHHSKDICGTKTKMDVEIIELDNCKIDSELNAATGEIASLKNAKSYIYQYPKNDIYINVDNSLTVTSKVRSCSPDIFDDEVSSIMDDSNQKSVLTSPKQFTELKSQYMDLTDCVEINSQKIITTNNRTNSQLSQRANFTSRKSNDFMEITDCVAVSLQPIHVNIIEENIDLTQSLDHNNSKLSVIEGIPIKIKNVDSKKEKVESLDLTQSSDSEDDLPIVHISGKREQSLAETVRINDHECMGIISKPIIKKKVDNEDIVLEKQFASKHDVNEVDVCNIEDNLADIANKTNLIVITNGNQVDSGTEECLHMNLKQFKAISPIPFEGSYKSNTQSFVDDYIHQHSDDGSIELSSEKSTQIIKEHPEKITILDCSSENEDDKVDLTQSTTSSIDVDQMNADPNTRKKNPDAFPQGNVSTDYDEIFDEIVVSHASSSKQKNLSESTVYDIDDDNLEFTVTPSKSSECDLVSNSSQVSEIFEIEDNELNYSMQKSHHDIIGNFNFGGISIMDDLSAARSSKSFCDGDHLSLAPHSLNKSKSDGFLSEVDTTYNNNNDLKLQTSLKSCDSNEFTPLRYRNPLANDEIAIETPTNSGYIIKTDEVTPMLDYASLTTPERNKELDRYGLKPFKRKRAIQLLSHLYNQTHPILQSCTSEDLPSPSKKQKPNECHTQSISPKKSLKSPRKCQTSPAKNFKEKSTRKAETVTTNSLQGKINIFEVTSDLPVILDLGREDDLIFQKRDKAKVHSCRVPLHIAFHNYVSSRCRLREAILRYEPVNIDIIHKGLVDIGFRYDPKDLLKFLDKKCITVKTADNSGKIKKHY